MQKTFILSILAIFCLSFFATTYAGQVEEAGMKWYDDMDEAKAAAEKGNKLIYIYFTGGVKCGWCVKMKKETFSDKEVQKKVLSKYVIAMLQVWDYPNKPAKAEDKALMQKYGGRGVPFNVVLDKNLELVKLFSGYKSSSDFIKELADLPEAYEDLAKLLKKVEKKSGQNYKNYYKLCMIYYEGLGKTDKAAEIAEKLLKNDEENKHKNNAQLNWILAENSLKGNKLEEANGYMKEVIKLDDANKEGYYERVIQIKMALAANKKDWDEMIKIYDSFVESKLKFHKDQEQTTKFYVSVAYLNKKDNENAKKMLKEVVDLDKDSPVGKQAAKYLKSITGGGY